MIRLELLASAFVALRGFWENVAEGNRFSDVLVVLQLFFVPVHAASILRRLRNPPPEDQEK